MTMVTKTETDEKTLLVCIYVLNRERVSFIQIDSPVVPNDSGVVLCCDACSIDHDLDKLRVSCVLHLEKISGVLLTGSYIHGE